MSRYIFYVKETEIKLIRSEYLTISKTHGNVKEANSAQRYVGAQVLKNR